MGESRKSFIKKSAFGMAGLTIGGMGMSSASYANIMGSNERLNLAVVGLGRRAHAWPEAIALEESNARLLYLCDVMKSRRESAAENYSEVLGYTPELENDVRKILEDNEVDAIINATPDHWHAPGTCYASEAGKHVYVEKPCSHNPREGELLVECQKKYGNVIQMGNQRRASAITQELISEIHNGLIGEPYKAVASYYNDRGEVPVATPAPVPEGLNWELFQGPAPRQEYVHNAWDYNWHWYGWKWGTAEAGNNAIHAVDIARWALQVEQPKRVVTNAHKQHFPDDGWTMYDTMDATLTFPGDKVIRWDGKSRNGYDTYGGQGPVVYGTEGVIKFLSSGYELYDREGDLIRSDSDEEDTGRSKINRHVLNFLNAIRGKAELNSPIDEGATSTLLCHLMNISARTGKALDVNAENGRIQDEGAMQLWDREYEPGWEPKI
ncbi:Predicted dehydrogenase [Fodinibius roseus]|uniref:Predicted dehydrogenase n=1 Tax=Fodinibius roseus TaxID=1194090 RepID=A0A1M4TU44_9BACT|nr:Gfo/Idh/MocA family oxidoreductase [Fodinibius roseus]SHE47827.1 Predicted dehydrogenase [Fodinibius roseus]